MFFCVFARNRWSLSRKKCQVIFTPIFDRVEKSRKIAEVRGLIAGQPAISPARFPDWESLHDFKNFAEEVRKETGGIPIGFKLSAQHIEEDIQAAIEIGVDYIILDGRGGGTGAAPLIFRDNISVPTMPAIARARKYLDETGNSDITLIATGGLLARRLCKSDSARCGRRRCCEFGHAGHRVYRHACMSYEQLSGRYRHTEGASTCAVNCQ